MVVINKTKTDETANTGSIKINGTSIANGEAISVPEDGNLEIAWTPTKNETKNDASKTTSLSFVKSVSVNGNQQVTSTVDKKSWTEPNTEYMRRTGAKDVKMVAFDKIASATQKISVAVDGTSKMQSVQTGNAKLSETATVQSVDVEFQEVTPVYRLYNSATSEHLFTTTKAEYDGWVEQGKNNIDNWIGEGIAWLAPKNYNAATTKKVYRLYHAGLGAIGHTSHYYTADEHEKEWLTTSHGWVQEGDYGFLSDTTSTSVPIYTCYNEGLRSAHHYTSSKSEWESLESQGWSLEREKNGTKGCFAASISAMDE